MGPLLLSRKVRGRSISWSISSSRLKTCQKNTMLVFVYLACTKYANEVTWLTTPRKALNLYGHTFSYFLIFSTIFMILRPLGMSFLHLALSRFSKGKVCYNDTLVLGDWILVRKSFIFKINEVFKSSQAQFCTVLYFVFSCTSSVK